MIEQQDSRIHGCWVWEPVNTKLAFDNDYKFDNKKVKNNWKHTHTHNLDLSTQANNL